MATKNTIEKLAECFPASMPEHLDIKKAMPEIVALRLLHSGFIDCTYASDECATYYIDKDWNGEDAPTIAAILVGKSLVYYVLDSYDLEIAKFASGLKAIDFYKKTFMGSK